MSEAINLRCLTCGNLFSSDEGCDCGKEHYYCPACGDRTEKRVRGCYEHTDNPSELKEECHRLQDEVDRKNQRIAELESQCLYKQACIDELREGLDVLKKGLEGLREGEARA